MAFSRRHGLGYRLGWWKQQLQRRTAAQRPSLAPSLAPLVPVAVAAATASAPALVVTVSEVRVEVTEATSASAAWVGELVSALREGRR